MAMNMYPKIGNWVHIERPLLGMSRRSLESEEAIKDRIAKTGKAPKAIIPAAPRVSSTPWIAR